MSTELISHPDHPMRLTRYYGGDANGTMIQITGPNCDSAIGYIGVTRDQALALATDLILFARAQEIVDTRGDV